MSHCCFHLLRGTEVKPHGWSHVRRGTVRSCLTAGLTCPGVQEGTAQQHSSMHPPSVPLLWHSHVKAYAAYQGLSAFGTCVALCALVALHICQILAVLRHHSLLHQSVNALFCRKGWQVQTLMPAFLPVHGTLHMLAFMVPHSLV